MTENSFGALLGKLVYRKRKILGLTQTQLAEDAYASVGKTRRISELESGSVANPHPKTIDPIIAELGITEEDLAECAAGSTTKPDTTLDLAYLEARNLINNLAEQFENENQDATLGELGDFLIAKAKEYMSLKENIQNISNSDEEFSKLKKRALSALSEGNYATVEDLLREAEEVQQGNQTMVQIRKQAEVRILRGDNKFLAGDLPKCFEMYKTAALYFEAFDQTEMIANFEELARIVYETGRRSIKPSFWVSQKLLEEALTRCTLEKNSETIGGLHYRLSLILRNQSAHVPQKEAAVLLDVAIQHARTAVTILAKTDEKYKLASSQIALGNCLSDLADIKHNTALGNSAIGVFEEVKELLSASDEPSELLGHACNGLGAALLRTAGSAQQDTSTFKAENKAMLAYEEAILASSRVCDTEIWGVAHINLGQILAMKANSDDIDREEAAFLRIRSISSFQSAIETYPAVLFPNAFAEAHFGLAEVLFSHGLDETGQLFEMYFARAIHSYSQASEIHSKETHAYKWAHIQCRLGSVFGNHAKRERAQNINDDIEMAISYFENGKSTFKDIGYQEGVESCTRNIALLNEELEVLQENEALKK